MLSSACRWILHWQCWTRFPQKRQFRLKLCGVALLLLLILVQTLPFTNVQARSENYTRPTVNSGCQHISFSSDGNPFPLCPGGNTGGGNCTWWAWEQWHLLGFDLPRNWGNAADWIVDAQRSGFSVGKTPRLASIAVFPRADGIWAYGPEGHVAFVTSVSADGSTFDVTYENYGDSTFMYVGKSFNLSLINQTRFQNNQVRFIYFPRDITTQRFVALPGISNDHVTSDVNTANTQTSQGYGSVGITSATFTNDRTAFGTTASGSEESYNADFTGKGLNDLVLYNRQQGTLNVLRLSNTKGPTSTPSENPRGARPFSALQPAQTTTPRLVAISDSLVGQGKWGSDLDIHVGDFSGSGETELLLYDRSTGKLHLLSFNPDLSVKKHTIITDFGTDWELYTGRFDGQRTSVFMYKRFAVADAYPDDTDNPDTTNPSPTDVPGQDTTGDNSYPPDNSTPLEPSPTDTATVTSTPTATTSPTPSATSTATSTPRPTATSTSTSTPTATATSTSTPTATATSTSTPTATSTATVTATATVTPTAVATATSTPTATATSTATPGPTATTTPTATPTATNAATPKPAATSTPTAGATASATPSSTAATAHLSTGPYTKIQLSHLDPSPTGTVTPGSTDDNALQTWNKKGRTANILLVDFDQDFHIRNLQQYSLWHANWEVYIGRFVNVHQDGLFLYDRTIGEGRLMNFDTHLVVNDYQEMHNLKGNWLIYSGDFANLGRAQMLLYDPSNGNGRLLAFNDHLVQTTQKDFSDLGINQSLYIGHFGLPSVSIMLYDPLQAQSVFLAFDQSLAIAHQYLTKSWDQSKQILVGAFLDRSRCVEDGDCSHGDDILILNRKNGQIEQYVFTFGRQFTTYDNRTQAFARQGADTVAHINAVDTTTFQLVTTLNTEIRNEELY